MARPSRASNRNQTSTIWMETMEEQITSGGGAVAAAPTEPRYVGFWARFVAMFIDNIWVTIVLVLVIVALFGLNQVRW